ncbi:MAG: phosphate ABC transporter substrate-binding protein [Anaerolineales bacterium]|nr:phosphate ABC transporter substrate-binding protein [Anaerolineales bacterium]
MRKVRAVEFVSLLVGLMILVLACGRQPTGTNSAGDGAPQRAIQNKGSDTLVNLALAWAETYRTVAPDVSIAVTGGGSGTGIASLINGTVDIANASRAMKESEIEDARKNGIEPQEYTVAIDALAVIVNQANPVSQLTIDQLADIFTGRVTNWQAVGGNDAPIILVSRETNSGTHVYFLEEVIRQGDSENKDVFAPQTLLMPSSVGITSEVQRNPNAIGYDGLGYTDPAHEKLIAVAKDAGSPFVTPSVATGADGTYPISRALYMYTVVNPNTTIAKYLDWVRGPEGQQIVAELGFVPLPLQ